jgi:tripartite-type tricarboxylate transporter receptor subunit TctC
MRRGVRWAAGLVALALALQPAMAPAQPEPDFSSRAIRIVSPFAAGSVSDISLRLVAERLGPRLRTQVLVDNQPTGGGTTAAQAVITAAPDGHTLALLSNATAVSVALFKRLPYDPLADFVPVSGLSDFAYVLLTGTGSRFTSMTDVLAAARARPGTLNFGTAAGRNHPLSHRAPPQEGGANRLRDRAVPWRRRHDCCAHAQ